MNANPIYPKYHRQKFLLAFLKYAGGHISKLDLQKMLFLYQNQYSARFFDFIPYLFGCYSFQANADLEVLQSQGWLRVNGNSIQLDREPQTVIQNGEQIKAFFSANQNLKGNDLLRAVYISHPFFAINSRISGSVLDEAGLAAVSYEKKRYLRTTTRLFTLGYEGISFEGYINQLIRNDVKILCDVRNNPLSRKFGFSKGMLSTILPKIGIAYAHIPELGIIPAKRQTLETEVDYSALFDDYYQTLPAKQTYVDNVMELLRRHHRVALTCFEKDPLFCHRHILSRYIEETQSIKVVDL